MSAIEATDLTRRFGSFTAVDDVALDVGAGEIVGLLGANGAGKTTLIKMLLGLLRPTTGRIRLFGQPQGRRQRGHIGYVPQNLGLYTDLTAAENLEFRAAVFGVEPVPPARSPSVDRSPTPRRATPRRLRRCDPAPPRAAGPRRTHVGRLPARSQPTVGSDPPASRGRCGVLVSTHYMDEAEQADRLVVMANGVVVTEGTVTEVVSGRQTVEVSSLRWSEAFAALDHDGRRLVLDGRNVRVLSGTIEDVDDELRQAGITADVTLVPATLNETLVELNP